MADGASQKIVAATSNPHKVAELRDILAPLGVQVLSLKETLSAYGVAGDKVTVPIEYGETFLENARIKAIHYASKVGVPCLADDSGLEVDALDGAPGVRSARYANSGGTREQIDAANNARLLSQLSYVPDNARTARFVCAMCLASSDGRVLAESRGTFEGRIGREPRGDNGFGYDPLFIIEDGRTSAELSPEEKNARSHRGHATREIAVAIKQSLGQ